MKRKRFHDLMENPQQQQGSSNVVGSPPGGGGMGGVHPLKRLKSDLTSSYERLLTAAEVSSTIQSRPVNAMNAPRGGTRGFRAPEVLLKFSKQTVSLDIWSAGVVLLCIMSQRYPFFHSPDDLSSLCEIATIQGTRELQRLGLILGRRLTFPVELPKLELRNLCTRLQSRPLHVLSSLVVPPASSSGTITNPASLLELVYDLLERCLDINHMTRITAKQALKHPFFS